RRRHTRLVSDWSSDVCSSDLPGSFVVEASYVGRLGRKILTNSDLAMPLNLIDPASGMDYFTAATALAKLDFANTPVSQVPKIPRSEERRVGKEGRSRCEAYQ